MRFASQTVHAHKRAHERFGLSFADLKRLGAMIVANDDACTFVKIEGEREKWIVAYGGREVPVVWDAVTKTIVTVLPKHALKDLHRELKPKHNHNESKILHHTHSAGPQRGRIDG